MSCPWNVTWLTGMVAYAEAASLELMTWKRKGSAGNSLPLQRSVALLGHRSRRPTFVATCAGLATVLGRYEEAEEYFALAWAASQGARAWFFAARTALSWGTMLTRRGSQGDAELAREMLTQAQDLAEDHGYANIARRAGVVLRNAP